MSPAPAAAEIPFPLCYTLSLSLPVSSRKVKVAVPTAHRDNRQNLNNIRKTAQINSFQILKRKKKKKKIKEKPLSWAGAIQLN